MAIIDFKIISISYNNSDDIEKIITFPQFIPEFKNLSNIYSPVR